MTEGGTVNRADLDAKRERTVDALCEHFANDVFEVEEFERRVDVAHRAETLEELRELLLDLPSGDLPIRVEDASKLPMARPVPAVPASRVKDRDTIVAVLSASKREGRWIPARKSTVVGVVGSVELDYREALLGPGVTEVMAVAVLGNIEILAPPGLYVECEGMAVLGNIEQVEDIPVEVDPDAPMLRIRGVAVLGNVEVRVRYPGETAHEARRRRRAERKDRRQRRRLRGG
jgi:hypothetical protein